MSLVDSINEAQLKIQEAISKAFNTKEVMDMYAARQGDYHRTQIEYLKAKFFTGKIDKETYIKETFDSLIALSKIDTVFLRGLTLVANTGGTEDEERLREERVRGLHRRQQENQYPTRERYYCP